MMKHTSVVLLLLALLLLLTSCAEIEKLFPENVKPQETAAPTAQALQPELNTNTTVSVRSGSILYFRYKDEPYLAPETRNIQQMAGQSYEYALLATLIGGPGTHSSNLHNVFPDNVRLLSTVRQGRMLFVTLSAEIMDAYADEPDNWQDDDMWRKEIPLRRELCMQAIVATVTENCAIDCVQILVQGDTATGSLRLKQNYFMDDSEEGVLVGPMRRDYSSLLDQQTTMQVLLNCWIQRDWTRLYKYVSGAEMRPEEEYQAFVAQMEALPKLVDAYTDGGCVSPDGMQATFVVEPFVTANTQDMEYPACIWHLNRENGIWKIPMAELTGWLEEDAI